MTKLRMLSFHPRSIRSWVASEEIAQIGKQAEQQLRAIVAKKRGLCLVPKGGAA